ncbi:protein TIFY 4B-like isoform X3 [Rhododendron vialii]|uniref:protein TIFY 4B-like isoform X3 n=2 Tax=Rhododendron vialii TaxID=182163 RepID=UPI0026604146|nr:protein TIFY 4B-like isoform X3 [Rhododendron vialii]
MSTEETVSRSPLDKPLHLLTEEDISQLTREDCRRYLKEKGMRRPSWNKSQAIQQVISLKTLLETSSDSDAVTRKKLHIPRPDNLHRVHRSTGSAPLIVPAEESPCRRKDPERNDRSDHGWLVDGSDSSPPRTAGEANGPLGQMTIFYCGKVNVYDDVPVDKAQALMQLAASPLQVPLEVPFDGSAARQPLPCHLQAASGRVGPDTPVVILPTQAVNMSDNCWPSREESGICREENTAEVPGSRKASVQRYLEKRKDRFKSKRKVATPPSASLDVYLNPQMGNQTQNERSNRSDACSSPQIRPPNTPTRSSSADDNLVKSTNFPDGLNEKDMRE